MTLKGIDVSSWNGSPFNAKTEAGFKASDFVIVKATEGTGYVNPACDYAVQRTLKAGKLMGYYHYANGGNAKKEAAFFYSNTKGYTKKGIPVLDWEQGSNSAFGSTTWAWEFAQEFHRLSGVWPMIYTGSDGVKQCAKCASKCALWFAGYPVNADSWTVPDFIYSTGKWSAVTVWQFTSGGGLDRNIAYLTETGWNKIAGKTATAKSTSAKKTYTVKLTRYLYPSPKIEKAKRIVKVPRGAKVTYLSKKSGSFLYVQYRKKKRLGQEDRDRR